MEPYKDFVQRLKLLFAKRPDLITITLSNIFTMRLIGNKTHGDLAEIAIAEFINQFMYDFRSEHVGKDLYRAKSKEEDIKIVNEITQQEFFVSLKAYGVGPLQLSTDKEFKMFPRLEQEKSSEITDVDQIKAIFDDPAFSNFGELNVLPLIYDEKNKKCNIMIFDQEKAKQSVRLIRKESAGRGRKHPVYRFYDAQGNYICEVRYGGPDANALQRGLWTHTVHAAPYFDSLTGGWVDYSHNLLLVKLFSEALVSSERGHQFAIAEIEKDIERLRRSKP